MLGQIGVTNQGIGTGTAGDYSSFFGYNAGNINTGKASVFIGGCQGRKIQQRRTTCL